MTLVERDQELATLDRYLGRADRGTGGMVIVGGPAGAGKTTLVRTFVQHCADVPVLLAACDPLATPRPLGPLHDVAGELGEEVAALLRDDDARPHDVFVAVAARMRSVPVVLVVDDLHWADDATIDLLRFLLRRLGTTRSLVIGAARVDEVGGGHPLRALLGDVARSPDATTVDIPPLSEMAIAELVGDRPLDAGELLTLTGGNPFFVNEMLDHAGEDLPATVRDAVLARTVGLGDEALALLDLLACAPEGIPDQVLPALGIGLPPLRELHASDLIRREERGVSFRHELVRLAIESALPPGGEVALHRRLLDALEAAPGTDPAVLAHHAVGTRDPEAIVRHASAAGRAAARSGAHTQAAALFGLALEHAQHATLADEATLLEQLAPEHYLIDHLPEAITAIRRARKLREAVGDITRVSADLQSLAVYEWYSADRAQAIEHAAEATEILGREDPDPATLGHAYALNAYFAMQASDLNTSHAFVERARMVAKVAHDDDLDLRLDILEAVADMARGGAVGRAEILTVVDQAFDQFSEIHSSGISNLTYLDVEHRRLDDASESLSQGLPLSIEWDQRICEMWQTGIRSRLHMLSGDWDRAVADADVVLDAPSAPLARTWPHLVRGLSALRSGHGSTDDLDDAWDLACRLSEPLRLLPATAALAERSWLTGAPDDRLADAERLLRDSDGEGLDWARGDLAVWLTRLGLTVPTDIAVAEPYALQLAGRYGEAAGLWEAMGSPYEQALALVDSGDDERIGVGLDQLDRLGVDAVAAKVRRVLREAGRKVGAPRRRATRENPAGLTARQVEVLRMLADGCTNAELAERLYISPKTADHHVSAILAKLQVTGRRDAVAAGRRLGLIAAKT